MRLARMQPNNSKHANINFGSRSLILCPEPWTNSPDPRLTSFVADRYPNLGNGAGFKPPAFECLDGDFV